MSRHKLDITEQADFQYLLALMVPLYTEPQYQWLPELFSIIGHENLIRLCRYAGGETIKIPTLDELSSSLEALDWFYKIDIKHEADIRSVPRALRPTVRQIEEIYNSHTIC